MSKSLTSDMLFGGLEAGGTKCVVGIGDGDGRVVKRETIPTTTPGETLTAIADWFAARGPITSLGIGTFGPADLDPSSPTWGHITNTPKPGWAGQSIGPYLRDRLNVPIAINTDVNAAALAEAQAQSGINAASDTIIYVTIGTGIGGGVIAGGQLLTGLGHPEMGHMMLGRLAEDATFESFCPFHAHCAEGLVAGPAIMKRWGASLSDLPLTHEAHDVVADYIAQLCVSLMAILAPHRIILGGGVMQTPALLDRVKKRTSDMAAGYFAGDPANIIVPPACGQDSGILGSLALAMTALQERNN